MLELQMPPEAAANPSRLLADPELRAELLRYVRGRGAAAEAEDVVQATLAEAVAGGAPTEPEALRRWLFAVARNKAVDCHRRTRREAPLEPEQEIAAQSGDPAAEDLLRWAERELPDREQAPATLEWLLREGAGEKLEEIAADASVPAPRVRQRVSRLRKHFRERWAAQLTAMALLGVVLVLGVAYWRTRAPKPVPPQIVRESTDPTLERVRTGRTLRRAALETCAEGQWQRCIAQLDAARELDPAGDAAPDVRAARERAAAQSVPPVLPPVAPTSDGKETTPPPKTNVLPKPRPAPRPKTEPPPQKGKAMPNKNGAASNLDGFENDVPVQQQLDFKK